MSTVVRGEYSRLHYKEEDTFGEEDGSGTWRRFGLTHSAVCPDPSYDYQPQWIHGEGREWKFMPGDAKELYSGSIPDIWLQNGRLFHYVLGQTATAGSYTHTVTPKMQLPSFTWEVNERNEAGTAVMTRRYHGCKVNRATLEAREGEVLVMGLDDIVCQNMSHSVSAGTNKYDAALSANAPSALSEQPYHFHEGQLSLFGTTFAEVKGFRLDINQNIEPKYYIDRSVSDEPIPRALHEGRTNFRCSATIDLVDTSIFTALLLKGVYTAAYRGFTGSLTFQRGGDSTDTIEVTLGVTSPTVTDPGCFLRNAPSRVVETPLIPIDVELEVPYVSVVVKDDISGANWS